MIPEDMGFAIMVIFDIFDYTQGHEVYATSIQGIVNIIDNIYDGIGIDKDERHYPDELKLIELTMYEHGTYFFKLGTYSNGERQVRCQLDIVGMFKCNIKERLKLIVKNNTDVVREIMEELT